MSCLLYDEYFLNVAHENVNNFCYTKTLFLPVYKKLFHVILIAVLIQTSDELELQTYL